MSTEAVSAIPVFELLVHTPIVFLHYLLSAVAIAEVFRLDWELFRKYKEPVSIDFLGRLNRGASTIEKCILGLFVTGIYFVVHGAMQDMAYTANEKLWMKGLVVGIIAVNGFFVTWIRHKMKAGLVLAELGLLDNMILGLISAVSLLSWLWACFLGVARMWNFQVEFMPLVILYGVSIAALYIPTQLYLFAVRQHHES